MFCLDFEKGTTTVTRRTHCDNIERHCGNLLKLELDFVLGKGISFVFQDLGGAFKPLNPVFIYPKYVFRVSCAKKRMFSVEMTHKNETMYEISAHKWHIITGNDPI